MSDTPSDVTQLLDQRYRERTAADRVRMAASMFGTAVALARAGIQSQHTGATEGEIRVLLLRRLYAGQLGEAMLSELDRQQSNLNRG